MGRLLGFAYSWKCKARGQVSWSKKLNQSIKITQKFTYGTRSNVIVTTERANLGSTERNKPLTLLDTMTIGLYFD